MLWEKFSGWLSPHQADELLAQLRTLYDYETSWLPTRATGWVYAGDTPGNQKAGLPPRDWPAVLAGTGPQLLDWLHIRTDVAYRGACYQAYLDGAGTGWHYDPDWPEQAIISLGATRTFGMRFRSGGREITFPLRHGDLLVMHAGCQEKFEHNVIEEPVQGERVSLVFRSAD